MPTATDVAAVLVGADLFWFLADSYARVGIALAVMLAAMVVSRFIRLLGESHRFLFRFLWITAVSALFLLAPLVVGEVSKTHGLFIASLLSLSVLGSDLLASVTDRVRIGSSAYIGMGICVSAFALTHYSGELTLVLAAGCSIAVSSILLIPSIRFGDRYLSAGTGGLGFAVPLLAAALFLVWLPAPTPAEPSYRLTSPDWLFAGPGLVVLLGLAVFLAFAFVVRSASQVSNRAGSNASDGEPNPSRSVRDRRSLAGYMVAAANGGLGGGLLVLIDGRIASLDGLILLLAMEVTINLVLTGRMSLLGSMIAGLFTLLLLGQATDTIMPTDHTSGRTLALLVALLAVGVAFYQLASSRRRLLSMFVRIGSRFSRLRPSSMTGRT